MVIYVMSNIETLVDQRFIASFFPQRKRHYWVLDWKSITLYQNESSTKYYKVRKK